MPDGDTVTLDYPYGASTAYLDAIGASTAPVAEPQPDAATAAEPGVRPAHGPAALPAVDADVDTEAPRHAAQRASWLRRVGLHRR